MIDLVLQDSEACAKKLHREKSRNLEFDLAQEAALVQVEKKSFQQ
jgi:hypothetical protein